MMKKGLLYLMVAAMAGFGVVSCSSDDDPNYAEEIAGNYKGTATVSIPSFEGNIPVNDLVISLAKTGENIASIKVEKLSIPGELLTDATFTIEGLNVSKSGDKYKISGEDKTVKINEVLTVEAVVANTSEVEGNACKLKITIKVNEEMTVGVDYTGSKQ